MAVRLCKFVFKVQCADGLMQFPDHLPSVSPACLGDHEEGLRVKKCVKKMSNAHTNI